MTDHFLSCDWGTSSFRLSLIKIDGLKVIGSENAAAGILVVFKEWQKKEDQDQHARQAFYLNVINIQLQKLETRLNISLINVPVIISGMASATIGILDIPYTSVPFAIDGNDLNTHFVKSTPAFPHDVLVISGAATDDDVMRGEETQLIGCFDDGEHDTQDEQLFIFPGTHSKHISVMDKKVIGFTTYMTGEFFALLSAHSILQTAVNKHIDNNLPSESFLKGVQDSMSANLLHLAFMVRTNGLFAKMTKEQNYDYLSGLIIGSELKDLIKITAPVYLCCNSNLEKYYTAALIVVGINERVKVMPPAQVDRSVIKGQFKILQNKGIYHG